MAKPRRRLARPACTCAAVDRFGPLPGRDFLPQPLASPWAGTDQGGRARRKRGRGARPALPPPAASGDGLGAGQLLILLVFTVSPVRDPGAPLVVRREEGLGAAVVLEACIRGNVEDEAAQAGNGVHEAGVDGPGLRLQRDEREFGAALQVCLAIGEAVLDILVRGKGSPQMQHAASKRIQAANHDVQGRDVFKVNPAAYMQQSLNMLSPLFSGNSSTPPAGLAQRSSSANDQGDLFLSRRDDCFEHWISRMGIMGQVLRYVLQVSTAPEFAGSMIRVQVVGPTGCGKSVFLKQLVGAVSSLFAISLYSHD